MNDEEEYLRRWFEFPPATKPSQIMATLLELYACGMTTYSTPGFGKFRALTIDVAKTMRMLQPRLEEEVLAGEKHERDNTNVLVQKDGS